MLAESLTGEKAPDFSNLRGWINTSPLTIESLKGKVVLLDFWTYSCVNCIRTLPHMKILHDRYGRDSFVLVGVHTPEFEFEKNAENVAAAVKRFGIEYPVAIDSDNTTWKLYGNQYWPRQTLIDANGIVRWEHAGEGDYDKMERIIQNLLRETGSSLENRSDKDSNKLGVFEYSPKTTPEIYTGSLRSQGFGNGQVCVPGSCTRYIDPKDHSRDVPYLQGDWTQFPEYIAHSTLDPGYIVLKYAARNANAVLGTSGQTPVTVKVELDEKPVEKDKAGTDVMWDKTGSSIIVKENRLYDIIRTRNFETHDLKLQTNSDTVQIYAYTFG
jgi:thiol-disulfide isomerase/thioredoxin